MSWNYRIIEHADDGEGNPWFAIHEVFYNEDGTPRMVTEDPVDVSGESPKEVYDILARMGGDAAQDLRRKPLKYDDFGTLYYDKLREPQPPPPDRYAAEAGSVE